MEMEKLFITGSVSIKELPEEVKKEIEHIRQCGIFHVFIGQAPGVDVLVQKELLGYPSVTIVNNRPIKRNLGNWEEIIVEGDDFAKDSFMARECDSCLAIWDGSSKGVRKNIDMVLARDLCVTVWTPNEGFKIELYVD